MKKISAYFLKASILLLVFATFITFFAAVKPQLAQAQQCETGYTAKGALCLPNQQVKGGFADATTVGGFLLQVVKILLIMSGIVAILFIVIGGFVYMTSGGNQESADKGKRMITNAIIGLVVVILSYTIISIVVNTVTTGNVLGTGGGSNTGGGTTQCPPGQVINPSTGQCG